MSKLEKQYKVTYKTYFNDRLKQVSFHGRLTYPLYIQVTFDRKSIFFKSYYFDLYSQSKYRIQVTSRYFAPDIKKIIEKEETLIDAIIDKNLQNFSLEGFKSEYDFYCRDLLDIMEEGFLEYLHVFLHDEGLPAFAEIVKSGARISKLYDLVMDMKKALTPSLYSKLLENSFYYAPPYLPLYKFVQKPQRNSLLTLSVLEWEQPGTIEQFQSFYGKNYPDKKVEVIIDIIQKWVNLKLKV